MHNDRLHTLILGVTAALLLSSLPASSQTPPTGGTGGTTDPSTMTTGTPCPVNAAKVDCDSIGNIDNKESWKASYCDLVQCIHRGYPVPKGSGAAGSGTSWVPGDGQGAGVTAGGAGGYSYGAIRAPESPPGSRNENASVSAAAITSSCNFPPRILVSLNPPSISFGAGSCLDFMNGVFADKNGCKSSGGSSSTTGGSCSGAGAPPGVDPNDTCPADSNNAGVYGTKQTATGSITVPCGGTVPVATADLTLNKNPDRLLTTTNGTYAVWTYHKSGTGWSQGINGAPIATFMCEGIPGSPSGQGHPTKTLDLTPPTEQMIT